MISRRTYRTWSQAPKYQVQQKTRRRRHVQLRTHRRAYNTSAYAHLLAPCDELLVPARNRTFVRTKVGQRLANQLALIGQRLAHQLALIPQRKEGQADLQLQRLCELSGMTARTWHRDPYGSTECTQTELHVHDSFPTGTNAREPLHSEPASE